MLNPFPSLLTYSFFAPTILRVVAAAVILMLAHTHRVKRQELQRLVSPIVGEFATYLIWIVIVVEALTGLGLFLGLYTQIAAIVGAVLALRSLVGRPKALAPFDRAAD